MLRLYLSPSLLNDDYFVLGATRPSYTTRFSMLGATSSPILGTVSSRFPLPATSEAVVANYVPLSPSSTVNICIVEPSGVRTNFEGHSKARTEPHPAYAADDMPSRKLEKYVQMGIKSGMGMIEPSAIADAIFSIASRGERVPLRVPLGPVAWKMAKAKYEAALKDLDEIEELSALGGSI